MESHSAAISYRRRRKRYINVLLLGKTGGGKSTTANMLLGKQQFQTSDDVMSIFQSVTQVTQVDEFDWRDRQRLRHIRVFDTPGFFDTDFDDAYKMRMDEIIRLRNENPRRFAPEDLDAAEKEATKAAKLRRKEKIHTEVST